MIKLLWTYQNSFLVFHLMVLFLPAGDDWVTCLINWLEAHHMTLFHISPKLFFLGTNLQTHMRETQAPQGCISLVWKQNPESCSFLRIQLKVINLAHIVYSYSF